MVAGRRWPLGAQYPPRPTAGWSGWPHPVTPSTRTARQLVGPCAPPLRQDLAQAQGWGCCPGSNECGRLDPCLCVFGTTRAQNPRTQKVSRNTKNNTQTVTQEGNVIIICACLCKEPCLHCQHNANTVRRFSTVPIEVISLSNLNLILA